MFTSDLLNSNNLNITEVGSKAANLNLLNQNGVSIPIGFVLQSNAYDLFLKKNRISGLLPESEEDLKDTEKIKQISKKIRDAIGNGDMPNEVKNEILNYSYLFNKDPVAVRSSGILEDLPKTSFAGQYDSYLNVFGFDEVLTHIKKCYASMWNERAIIYRKNNGLSHNRMNMAVVIQKMINAKISGVLFTRNPMSSHKNEMVIESNFGLGESIVSGIVNPDEYILYRQGDNNIRVRTARIGDKNVSILPNRQRNKLGTENVKLSEALAKKSSISTNQIHKLAKIGIEIEKIMGNIPQDIEWAIDGNSNIHILQTRPVTTIRSPPKQILWSRGYSDDYWNDNTTPLFFDIMGTQITKVVNMELNSIMGYKKIDALLLKLFKGHVYFNLNVLKKKVENEIPPFMRNVDILNYFPEGSGPYGKLTIKNLSFHLKNYIFAQIRIKFHDPDGGISKTAEVYENWTKNAFNPFCKAFDAQLKHVSKTKDLAPLMDLANELDEIMISHFRLVRYGIPIHNIGMNLLAQYLLNRFLGKKLSQRVFPILISGLKHKLTETNDQIHHLESIIQNSKYLNEIFINKNSKNILEVINQDHNQDSKRFLIDLDVFLRDFGDRGYTREPYYPRWREQPSLVFDILKSLVQDNDRIKTEKKSVREQVENLVESKIRKQQFGFLKWLLFSRILKQSRRYIIFRENQRFNLDAWITRIRNLYLVLGQILFEKGLLTEAKEIFFLNRKEINKLIKTKSVDLKLKAKRRLTNFKEYENVLPPKFLVGSKEFDDKLKYDQNCRVFQGIPASQGIITAPVRIINDIEKISRVQFGEILIVPRTDPGWTPVFSKIGGLITETGGILSHGAVVSREYGIPAVTNVQNSTKLFSNGQIVMLNGNNGIIRLKKGDY